MRKLCRDGPQCSWKPRCRYVHPEDGESIPPWVSRQDRAHRVETSHPREDIRPSREEARRQDVSHQREETRPSSEEAKRQEASHTREETSTSMEEARGLEANTQVFVKLGYSQPPPGYTMINFPGLEQPQNPNNFPWMSNQ